MTNHSGKKSSTQVFDYEEAEEYALKAYFQPIRSMANITAITPTKWRKISHPSLKNILAGKDAIMAKGINTVMIFLK